MTTIARRTGGIAASVAASVVLCSPAFAASPSGADGASSYLAGQLAASSNILQTSSYPDYGLTADAILGLAVSGTSSSQATAATAAFEKNVAAYDSYGDDRYAGATAKAALVAETAGQNPRAFGGQDLVSTLQGLEATTGRFSDKSAYGDYSNTLTQSLAIIALHRTGAPVDAKAVSYLLSLQCSDGGFRMMPDSASCTSDSDATSFAIHALSVVGGHSADIRKAAASLVARQGADGGLGGGVGTSAENANSTGLAAAALRLAGDTTHAAKATAYVKALQYGCAMPATLRGSIAYNAADFAAVSASKTPQGNEIRSTAQAVLALSSSSYLTSSFGSAAIPALDCSTTTAPSTSTTSKPATAQPSTSPATTSTSATVEPTGATSAPTQTPSAGSTAASSTSATSEPSAPVATSTPTASATGPVVNTDNVNSASSLPLGVGAAAAALAGLAGAVTYARRR